MFVIPDFRLIHLMAEGVKVTHRVPSGVTRDGYLSDPKVGINTEHKVYERSPVGSHGDRSNPWFLTVYVEDIWHSKPYEWDDEDMPLEGFSNLEAYGCWWDDWRAGTSKLCRPWKEMQNSPFHCFLIKPIGKTMNYDVRLQQVRSS
jgi:hypothetical protein